MSNFVDNSNATALMGAVEESIANTRTFKGTLDQWDALTAEEKAKYSFIATPEGAAEIVREYSLADFRKGDAFVENVNNYIHLVRCGNVVRFTATLLINTDGADKSILLGLPKPKTSEYFIATEASAANTVYKFSVTAAGVMLTNWGTQWPAQRQFVLTGCYITID